MNRELESNGLWSVHDRSYALPPSDFAVPRSTIVRRRAEMIVCPGAPLRITSLALPFALHVPAVERGLYRSVLQMSYRERGATEYEGSVTLAVLVPEKVSGCLTLTTIPGLTFGSDRIL